ncbi:Putative Protein bimA [[Torrubiella] hemipterigena]|uniref:Protein bimA n=1 Tax=[Torrubiella] hemipterigena TaxID=1531966 RepID=A0A0A1TNY3_9HYPO|nr:Putative Protein bimA [[Torrubiella] hemipterigena]
MAPNPPHPATSAGLFRQLIHYHLDNSAYDNALFFAERYATQDPRSGDARHLYALSHLRLGDSRSAYDVSKPMGYRGIHLGCAWVFAQACYALERYKDGITALENAKNHWSSKKNIGKHSSTTRAALPDAPAVLCLLGKLHRANDDKKNAISCFEEALKLSPFQWSAFTALCDMGASVRVPNTFRCNEAVLQCFDPDSMVEPKSTTSATAGESILKKNSSFRNITSELGHDPFNISFPTDSAITDVILDAPENDFMTKIQNARLRNGTNTNQPLFDGMETPPGPSTAESFNRPAVHGQEAPQAPPRRIRTLHSMESETDAPPRMNYRLGTKKSTRTLDKDHDQAIEPMQDAPGVSGAGAAAGTARTNPAVAPDRKRTLSGHPVARSTNADEPMTRRSARLGMFKPSARANSGAATIGASAGRELKKARPPISRIIRPGSSGSSVGRVVSGNRKPLEHNADVDHGETARVRGPSSQTSQSSQVTTTKVTVENEAARLEDSLKWILDIMKKLGNGYYALSKFQCQEALQYFQAVPLTHQGSPWVLAQIGHAHYEQGSYAEAEKSFRKMRVQAPSRLEDMEVYSTILWHLKRETDLSFLAHELVDSAWDSPQAWCALGNAWSLTRDTEQALKCFKRATQLDPKFAYAFTLQGHEHVTNEEYEKALTAYRQAISADKRHYNAYYGIGRVQERLGVYDKAYLHFQAAQTINPNNAVLISCIGTILEKQKQVPLALRAYTRAVELAPKAASTRYSKARALLALGQFEEAQKELMILKDLAPDEARVHFLLGTLYRNMNEKQLSVHHFTVALSLDAKNAQKIKEAIESFEDEVVMDDSIMT